MALPNTLLELTENQYSELRYDASAPIITGAFVEQIIVLLEQCDVKFNNDGHEINSYDEPVAQAVREFQEKIEMKPANGILAQGTYAAALYYEKRMSDVIFDDTGELVENNIDISKSPHYNSFFTENAFKQYRQNHNDIKIVFGDYSIVKTIKDVHMRSVSVEVDTSGNPISEVYEFIARDIVESDEISDINKYDNPESMAPSDIKYIYNINGRSI